MIFGPHPRDHSRRLPRRARREALADALHGKLRDGEVIGIEEFPSGEPLKTRRLVELLEGLGLRGSSCLLAVGPAAREPGGGVPPADDVFSDVRRMARNIPRVSVTRVENLNARDVIRHRCLLLGRAGIEFLFPAEGAPEEEAAS